MTGCWYCPGQLKQIVITYDGSEKNIFDLLDGEAEREQFPVRVSLAAECLACHKTYITDGNRVITEIAREDLSEAHNKSYRDIENRGSRLNKDGELNPNHPTTQAVSSNWHKFLALLMLKLGHTHLVLTEDDLEEFLSKGYSSVVVEDGRAGDNCLHFRLVGPAEAERLAREEGGLPC